MRNNGLEVRHFEPGFTARNQYSENRGSTVVYDTVLTNIEGYDSNRVAETVFELIWPQQILTELCLLMAQAMQLLLDGFLCLDRSKSCL